MWKLSLKWIQNQYSSNFVLWEGVPSPCLHENILHFGMFSKARCDLMVCFECFIYKCVLYVASLKYCTVHLWCNFSIKQEFHNFIQSLGFLDPLILMQSLMHPECSTICNRRYYSILSKGSLAGRVIVTQEENNIGPTTLLSTLCFN